MKKKIWFFVEGDSEEHFVTQLVRKKFYQSILKEKDLSVFVAEDHRRLTHHKIYCENCQSVDKIPHRINEWYYLIKKSRSRNIIVVCDVEKLKCFSKRKAQIESKLKKSVDKSVIKYVFFNPMIEPYYWDCPEIIKKITELEYKKKFPTVKVPNLSIPGESPHTQDALKKHFKRFRLKYREALFSKQFFPRIDYEQCDNKILNRLAGFLETI